MIYRVHPNWVTESEVATWVHVLNKTWNKLNLDKPKEILEQKDFYKKCKTYLTDLPKEVGITNLVQFNKLPKFYNIPDLGGNYNSELTEMLNNQNSNVPNQKP